MDSHSSAAAKEFKLEIRFAGLCFFLFDKGNQKTAVILPDARAKLPKKKGGTLCHRDGTPARPHIGYLRFDLRNVEPGLAGSLGNQGNENPAYHVIHPLDRQHVTLSILNGNTDPGFPADDPYPRIDDKVIPHVHAFAPCLQPNPEILFDKKENPALARIDLSGGNFSAPEGSTTWAIEKTLAPINFPGQALDDPFEGNFTKETTWTLHCKGDGITITLKQFGEPFEQKVTLKPRPGSNKITVHIGNLCCENPFDLEELKPKVPVQPEEDEDFKWFYTLLQLDPTREHRLDFRARLPRPCPQRKDGDGEEGDLQGCTSLRGSATL